MSLRVRRARALRGLLVNIHQQRMISFGSVFEFEFPPRSHPHSSHARGVLPCPVDGIRELITAAWVHVKAGVLVRYDLTHAAQTGTDHWRPAGKGFHYGHGKILITQAGQDEETCLLDGLQGLRAVQTA